MCLRLLILTKTILLGGLNTVEAGTGPWCRKCVNSTDPQQNPLHIDITCSQSTCDGHTTTCKKQEQCEDNQVCVTIMDLSHLTQLPPAFMNETQKTVGLKAWMTCLSVEQLGLTESLKTDIPQKCIINPSTVKNRFMCLCTDDNCNGDPTFVEKLPLLAKQYLVSDDPPSSLFGENLWVVVMIVFGVAVIFVTIGLVIVTIAKRRNNMDDNQEDHDFDSFSSIQADDETETEVPQIELPLVKGQIENEKNEQT